MSNNTDMQSLTLLLKKFITNKNTHYGPYLRKFQKELSILSSKLDKSMEEFQDTSIQSKIKAIINFPPFDDV